MLGISPVYVSSSAQGQNPSQKVEENMPAPEGHFQNVPVLADFNLETAFGYRHSGLRHIPNYKELCHWQEAGFNSCMILHGKWNKWFSGLFLKRSEFGKNKTHDTFSPDATVPLQDLPFITGKDRVPAHSPQKHVYSKHTCMHLSGNDGKKVFK